MHDQPCTIASRTDAKPIGAVGVPNAARKAPCWFQPGPGRWYRALFAISWGPALVEVIFCDAGEVIDARLADRWFGRGERVLPLVGRCCLRLGHGD